MTDAQEASSSHQVVVTRGGAVAMRDCAFGEVMHPIVGPLHEPSALYARPSRLAERLTETSAQPLVVWDVGLGAGSNARAALHISEARADPSRCLKLVSFDRTTAALELALTESHAASFGFDDASGACARALLAEGGYESAATSWSLVLGELPGTLLASCAGPADIVYWDPFSPRSNAALWSLSTFAMLREKCATHATVHTYGAATSTRAALLLAGFAVGVGVSSGDKAETTVAATNVADLERPLGRRWIERFGRSSAPLPFDAPADAMAQITRAEQFLL